MPETLKAGEPEMPDSKNRGRYPKAPLPGWNRTLPQKALADQQQPTAWAIATPSGKGVYLRILEQDKGCSGQRSNHSH